MQQNDWNNIFDSLKKNDVSNEKVSNAVEHLSEEQKKTLDDLLNDPELLKKFMSSPKAQRIMDKLNGK